MPDATADAPCTCGNFGPGFDVFSLALGRRGDRVRLREASEDRVTLTGLGAEGIPADFTRNAAAIAVDHLRRTFGLEAPLHVAVDKGAPPGSGLGSSASSSAAGALAFRAAYRAEAEVTDAHLLEAALAGERAVAGEHRDDISAALFRGLALVPPAPEFPRRLDPPETLRLAIVRPHVTLETRRMRAALPREVPLGTLTHQLARVALMVDAVQRGDVPAIGRHLEDRVAAPARGPLIPGYEACRAAALDEGAYGFAICGSGPAMLALTDREDHARALVDAMLETYMDGTVEASGFVTGPALPGRPLGPPPAPSTRGG